MLTAEKSVWDMIEENRASLDTPYYLIDESRLLKNLKLIDAVRDKTGAKSVLALKCFSTWAVFDVMKPYLDGTTSSSLFEARLGREKFGKEVHAYSVAFSEEEIDQIKSFATKIIFNSVSQLNRFYSKVSHLPVGLRINPGVSHSDFDLADPARKNSRLGAGDLKGIESVHHLFTGAMFHCNCENDDLASFSRILDRIGKKFASLLKKLDWVSLGGGIYFTKEGYPFDKFCDAISGFSRKFDVQVYLEPGEAAVTRSGYFVTRILDIVKNGIDIAVVDGAVEPHMLDLLIYNTPAKIDLPEGGRHRYQIAGRTCLAGDIFGTYDFPKPLRVGDLIPFSDAAGYTMVKKNWFNGLPMPSIAVRRLDGRVEVVKRFGYEAYRAALS